MIRRKVQTHNGGIVKIFRVSDISAPGNMPKDGITLKCTLRYHERTLGINRVYSAMQAGEKVDMVIRCPLLNGVSAQDIAIPNDGKQYRIQLVQHPEDTDPPVMDLTLERLEQDYAIE